MNKPADAWLLRKDLEEPPCCKFNTIFAPQQNRRVDVRFGSKVDMDVS
jgi:hypothetical protein